VDSGGTTNDTLGLVERNGTFWVENLALADGTNVVTLLARDAAGNLSSTNLLVVKSSVIITITSTPEGEELNQPFGTVYGTVSDPSYAVYVNGAAATVDSSGTWVAENVPLIGRGTVTFDAVSVPPGGSGMSPTGSIQKGRPARIEVVQHKLEKVTTKRDPWGNALTVKRAKGYSAALQTAASGEWLHNWHGKDTDRIEDTGWRQAVYEWTRTNKSTLNTDSFGGQSASTNIDESHTEVTGVPDQDLTEFGGGGAQGDEPQYIYHYYARNVRHSWPYMVTGEQKAQVSSRTSMHLYTGGKAGIKRKSLIHIKAHAHEYSRPPDGPWLHTPTTNIPPNKIKVFGWWLFGRHIDPWGDLYIVLPDDAEKDLNLRIPGFKHYGAWAEVEKLRLEVNSVSFQDHQEVFRDDGSGNYPGLWFTNDVAGTEQGYPVLYVSGDMVKTFTIFRILGGGTFPLRIRGKVNGGSTSFTLEGTNDTSGLTMLQVDTVADECLTQNRVDFFNPMTIRWQYAYVNSSDFLDAGRSTNQVFVTLGSPLTGVPLYHTVVHLACSESGAMTTEQAVANTWSLFVGCSVRSWEGIPLTYYGSALPGSASTATLVRTHDGDCDSFADLLCDSFMVNGVSDVRKAHIWPATGHNGLAVKNILFDDVAPQFPGEPIYKYGVADLDESPVGIPGQNMNPPSTKIFNYHRIVHRGTGTEYYDPSYGITTVGDTDYAPHIDAWGLGPFWRRAEGSGLLPEFEDD
jgi:hypothetical protein